MAVEPAQHRLLEHRCARRHPVERTVLLRSPSRGEMPATLVNIGAGGACIRLTTEALTGCRLVEVLVPGRDGTLCWPALVVHRQGALLGLMFDRPRGRELEAILGAWRARAGRSAGRSAA